MSEPTLLQVFWQRFSGYWSSTPEQRAWDRAWFALMAELFWQHYVLHRLDDVPYHLGRCLLNIMPVMPMLDEFVTGMDVYFDKIEARSDERDADWMRRMDALGERPQRAQEARSRSRPT